MPEELSQGEVTRLLDAADDGDQASIDRLMPLVYEELRRLARHQRSRHGGGQTLNTTGLVHEAYLRVVGSGAVGRSRGQFFALAATAMRSAIVDHARRRGSDKRGGGWERVPLDEALLAFDEREIDVIALDSALTRLAEADPRMVRVVELRFFAGMTSAQTAEAIGVSTPTVERDWRLARAWLRRELEQERD